MKLQEFYDMYQAQRHSCLSIDQFSSLLVMYPAGLVALADGTFDKLEKQNIVAAIKGAADEDELVMCEMYKEFCHMLCADATLRYVALECIKEETNGKGELKSIIAELMTSTAEAADGISDKEKKAIDDMKKLLNL
ncbi:MAG: hypothetical protein IKJ81_06450 [Bacteroidales bacterium]|nr:hypothetical protein [Bacteroidales bacterium]